MTFANTKARRFSSGADELPAHQGMQLGVLVDRCVDPLNEAGGFEIGKMVLEV
jgi:hypothetical protein